MMIMMHSVALVSTSNYGHPTHSSYVPRTNTRWDGSRLNFVMFGK